MRDMDLDYSQLLVTRQWFSKRNLATFRTDVLPRYKDKPCVYLEIGVYEGCSARWMCDYVLTHPQSYMVGVDTWLQTSKRTPEEMEEVLARARFNLKPHLEAKTPDGFPRCTLVRAMSADAVRMMVHRAGRWGIRRGGVDVCMIDGHHSELAVLDDARFAIQLVKKGGLLIFDDVRNDKVKEDHHVVDGINMFLQESGHKVKMVFQGRYLDAYERVA